MNHDLPEFTLDDVLKATHGTRLSGAAKKMFRGVSTDSRQISEGNIFIALKGENFDGHHFVQSVLDADAAVVLVQDARSLEQVKDLKDAAVILVADTLAALGDLAHYHRMRFSLPVIGLTGSSGKTTTKEMLASICQREKNVLKTQGNLNNLIGLPQTIFGLNEQHELAILEMGSNTRGEIKRLTQIAAPDIGLITNIGPAHLAGFGSMDVVREEKGDLFFNMNQGGTAVINLDDEAVGVITRRWTGRCLTFGMGSNADVSVRDIEKSGARGVSFNLLLNGHAQKVDMKITGIHHIYNAIAAAAVATAVGISPEAIRLGLKEFRTVGGRMEMIKLQNSAYLLDDSYNANPASVREALMTLKDLKNSHNAYVFLGDMLELGEAAPEMHRRVGMLLATIGVKTVFLQGDFAKATAAGAAEGGLSPENILFLQEPEEGIAYLKKHLSKGDWVLVKGSRGMKMERIVAKICEHFGGEKSGTSGQKTAH